MAKRVVSYSLYGTNPLYIQGAIRNVRLVPSIYPGWTPRVYVSQEIESWAIEALEQAGASEFVRSLPSQLDYKVGPRGSKLSGGQKQRISIAAAILRQSDILIFDEVLHFFVMHVYVFY